MHTIRPISFQKTSLIISLTKRTFTHSSRLQNAASAPSKLAGKRCIITGASRGIGAEIARRFAKEGARCLLIGRNETSLERVKAELKEVEGEGHGILVGDVGDGEFWGGLRKEVSF